MASGQAFGGKASVKKYEVKPLPCLSHIRLGHFRFTQGVIKGSIMDYCGDEIRKNYKIVGITMDRAGQVSGATYYYKEGDPVQSIGNMIFKLGSKAADKAKGICEFLSVTSHSPVYYAVDHFNVSFLPPTSQLPIMEIGYTCNIICLEKKKP